MSVNMLAWAAVVTRLPCFTPEKPLLPNSPACIRTADVCFGRSYYHGNLEQFPAGYAIQMSSAFVFLLFPFIILKHSCVSNSIRSCRPFHFNTESRRRAELKQRSVQPIILLFWVSGRVWLWVEGCGDLFIHPSRWRKARISNLTHWEAFSETSHNIACAIDSL